MTIKLLAEHLEFLSLKGGCKGSSESTLVKMPHCWKSHVTAHILSRPSYLSNCEKERNIPPEMYLLNRVSKNYFKFLKDLYKVHSQISRSLILDNRKHCSSGDTIVDKR